MMMMIIMIIIITIIYLFQVGIYINSDKMKANSSLLQTKIFQNRWSHSPISDAEIAKANLNAIFEGRTKDNWENLL